VIVRDRGRSRGLAAKGTEIGRDVAGNRRGQQETRSLPALCARAEWFESAKSTMYRAHMPWSLPLHEDEGTLDIDRRRIVFHGTQGLTIDIAFRDIVDVRLGFDATFKRRNEQYFGLFGKPLRVTYVDGRVKKNVYFFMDFEQAGRRSQNKVWYAWLESLRPE